jgi:hypothetical protein
VHAANHGLVIETVILLVLMIIFKLQFDATFQPKMRLIDSVGS